MEPAKKAHLNRKIGEKTYQQQLIFQDSFTSCSFKNSGGRSTSDSMELMPLNDPTSTPPSFRTPNQSQYGYGNVARTSSSSMMAPLEASTIMMKVSSSTATSAAAIGASSEERLLERFGSIDSSDTFLSCNTHAFPSQGSLAGLEELAAVGSMAANGSMPSVNMPGFNNQLGIYMHVNPFDPPSSQRRSHKRISNNSQKQYTSKAEELNERRRVRMNLKQRSMSSDIEITDEEYFESQNMPTSCKTYTIQNSLSVQRKSDSQKTSGESTSAPKHQRARVSQVRMQMFICGISSISVKTFLFIKVLKMHI